MKSILVVDDEKDLGEVICQGLADNFTTYRAQSGMQAISMVTLHNIDFVFSDIEMPKMNGFELLKNIRKIDVNKPVCLMTGNPDYNRDFILSQGANYFFI